VGGGIVPCTRRWSGAEVRAPYYSAFFVSEGKLARVLSFRTEDEALEAAGLRE